MVSVLTFKICFIITTLTENQEYLSSRLHEDFKRLKGLKFKKVERILGLKCSQL